MKLRKKHKEQSEVQVDELNDILFILLFFFLLASTFAGLNAMRVNLPKGKSDTKVAQRFVITVDSTNKAYFNTTPVIIDSLPSIITTYYKKDTTVKNVVFNGDLNTNYGEFIKVLAIANKLGLKVAVNVAEDRK